MTPTEELHYAIGQMAFALACADGAVQSEERDRFFEIIREEFDDGQGTINTGEIIFRLLDKRNPFDTAATYELAMNTIRANGTHLSPALKSRFIHLLERVAAAYPPVTADENRLLEKVRQDLQAIHGDPTHFSVH